MLRRHQVPGSGEQIATFRDCEVAKTDVEQLRRARVQADVRCFQSLRGLEMLAGVDTAGQDIGDVALTTITP